MNSDKFSQYVKLSDLTLTDEFWKKQAELVRKEVIPYQYEALHDRIDGAEKSYSIENFIKAGKTVKKLSAGECVPVYPTDKWCYDDKNCPPDSFHGWVFQDSDVYKWLEAVAFSLMNHPDSELEEKTDRIIDIVCAAQLSDGYLDTLFIINNIKDRFTNLRDWHELYCFGHLAEAAVAYYTATGKRKLLDAALSFADLICDTFGEDKIKGYPGHEIAEMALVKLFDITGEKTYLDTARFFIEERGKKPYYFDVEQGKTTVYDNYHYNQAHCQPKYQTEATGHAVRGVYLYSGMADIAKRCNDDELYGALLKISDNIINKKMFITGGIGSTVDGEAFSFDYDLPDDLCYNETCASIGLIFFLRRMLEICPDAVLGDTIERALYNTVLAGMALDGKSFFYVNPLEVNPEASHKDSRKRHIKAVRQKWFSCACCPPNIARLISSVNEYAFTENDNIFYVHQYIGSVVAGKKGRIEVISDYVKNGRVTIKLIPERPFMLALRIPLWCKKYSFNVPYSEKDGYAYFNITADTEIRAEYEPDIRLIRCSNRVRGKAGAVAVTRGPFVYCLEEIDNGKVLQRLLLDIKEEAFFDGENITAPGYREKESELLYSEWAESEKTPVALKLIPYYKWANRGENEMQVYVRVDN